MSNSEIKPPAGIKWQSRTAADLATDAGRRTTDNVWRCVQRGLVYPSPYATFVTFFRQQHPKSAMTKKRLGKVLADARRTAHRRHLLGLHVPPPRGAERVLVRGELHDAANGLVSWHYREGARVGHDLDTRELRDVTAAQPHRLHLEHGTTRRRIRNRELP